MKQHKVKFQNELTTQWEILKTAQPRPQLHAPPSLRELCLAYYMYDTNQQTIQCHWFHSQAGLV